MTTHSFLTAVARWLGLGFVFVLFLPPAHAQMGRRIALVIGNSEYQHSQNLPRLENPTNDAQDISSALRGFGFEVIERKNQTLEGMNQAIAEFGSKIGGSDAALFYFAGHGLQVKNQNYLMPVNARIESEAVVPYQGVNVNQILDELDNGKSNINIVILDACRNNPISGKFRSGQSRGLASPGTAPKATVIVYATDPGNVAADGDGRNGLFTSGLLTAFKSRDLSLDNVLTVASAEVERASGQTQTPYVNGPKTVQKNFYFRPHQDLLTEDPEKESWSRIERSNDLTDFEAFLRIYPHGKFRALAENRVLQLSANRPSLPVPITTHQPIYAPGPATLNATGTAVTPGNAKRFPFADVISTARGSATEIERSRCAAILNKAALGEPLRTTEKQELTTSCR